VRGSSYEDAIERKLWRQRVEVRERLDAVEAPFTGPT
jgi:hypothetical protein